MRRVTSTYKPQMATIRAASTPPLQLRADKRNHYYELSTVPVPETTKQLSFRSIFICNFTQPHSLNSFTCFTCIYMYIVYMSSKPFVEAKTRLCPFFSKAASISLRYKYGLFSYKTLGLNSVFPGDKNPHVFNGTLTPIKRKERQVHLQIYVFTNLFAWTACNTRSIFK